MRPQSFGEAPDCLHWCVGPLALWADLITGALRAFARPGPRAPDVDQARLTFKVRRPGRRLLAPGTPSAGPRAPARRPGRRLLARNEALPPDLEALVQRWRSTAQRRKDAAKEALFAAKKRNG